MYRDLGDCELETLRLEHTLAVLVGQTGGPCSQSRGAGVGGGEVETELHYRAQV